MTRVSGDVGLLNQSAATFGGVSAGARTPLTTGETMVNCGGAIALLFAMETAISNRYAARSRGRSSVDCEQSPTGDRRCRSRIPPPTVAFVRRHFEFRG